MPLPTGPMLPNNMPEVMRNVTLSLGAMVYVLCNGLTTKEASDAEAAVIASWVEADVKDTMARHERHTPATWEGLREMTILMLERHIERLKGVR